MVIDNRWVLRTKPNIDGLTKRFRAGLVAKGHVETAGIDYDKTFRPVERYAISGVQSSTKFLVCRREC